MTGAMFTPTEWRLPHEGGCKGRAGTAPQGEDLKLQEASRAHDTGRGREAASFSRNVQEQVRKTQDCWPHALLCSPSQLLVVSDYKRLSRRWCIKGNLVFIK